MLTRKVLSLLALIQLTTCSERNRTKVLLGYLTDITGKEGRQVSLALENV